jgi:transposase
MSRRSGRIEALHRVRERLVSQRTGIINQIRAFLLERGIAVRQGQCFLRAELPRILATPPEVLQVAQLAPVYTQGEPRKPEARWLPALNGVDKSRTLGEYGRT